MASTHEQPYRIETTVLRKTVAAVFAASALLLLAACGSDDGEPTQTTTVTETPENVIEGEVNLPGVSGEVLEENDGEQ